MHFHMKSSIKVIALLTAFGVSNAVVANQRGLEIKGSGENCNVSVEVSCKIVGGEYDGYGCDFLQQIACRSITLKFRYKYCNRNESEVHVYNDLTTPKLHSDELYGFNKEPMIGEDCRIENISKTFNTCTVASTAASMKLEGCVSDGYLYDSGVCEDTFYCYGYDHLKVKLRRDELQSRLRPKATAKNRNGE